MFKNKRTLPRRKAKDTNYPTTSEESSSELGWNENKVCDHVFAMGDVGLTMFIDGFGNGLKIKGRIDSFGGRAILQQAGSMMNVVIRERNGLHMVYKILGTLPAYPGQTPHKLMIKGEQLFVHCTLRRTSHFSKDFTIQRLDRDINYLVQGHSRFGPTHLKIFDSRSKQYCGSVRQFFKNDIASKSKWQVRVKEGIEPNIMICLTAIVNKSMGRDPANLLNP